MSASDTWVCTVIVDRSAMRITTGACWLVLSVWPWRAVIDTTVPAIGDRDAGVLQVGLVGAQGRFDLLDLRAQRLS